MPLFRPSLFISRVARKAVIAEDLLASDQRCVRGASAAMIEAEHGRRRAASWPRRHTGVVGGIGGVGLGPLRLKSSTWQAGHGLCARAETAISSASAAIAAIGMSLHKTPDTAVPA